MADGRHEPIHTPRGFGMGGGTSDVGGHRGTLVLAGVLDGNGQGGATVRYDVRWPAGSRSGSESLGYAPVTSRTADPARGPVRPDRGTARTAAAVRPHERCRRAVVKLAVYYATIAVLFGALATADPAIAQSVVTGLVLGALLAPALYAEFLRVKNSHDA